MPHAPPPRQAPHDTDCGPPPSPHPASQALAGAFPHAPAGAFPHAPAGAFPHAPAGAFPHVFSASQIDLLTDCPRAYAYKYIAKIRTPPSPYAAFGTRVHGMIEAHVKHGAPVDVTSKEGKCASALLRILPTPWQGLELEGEARLTTPLGNTFIVKRDVYRRVGRGGVPMIGDFKTTSSIAKWGKMDLTHDVQATVYAWSALVDHPDADRVHLRWMTAERASARAVATADVVESRAAVMARMAKIDLAASSARGILALKIAPEHVAADYGACGRFGGCEHREYCPGAPQLFLPESRKRMDPVADYLARFAGQLIQSPFGPIRIENGQAYGPNGALPVEAVRMLALGAPPAPAPAAPAPAAPAAPHWGPYPPGQWLRNRYTGHEGVVQPDGRMFMNVEPPGKPAGYAPQDPAHAGDYEPIPPPAHAYQPPATAPGGVVSPAVPSAPVMAAPPAHVPMPPPMPAVNPPENKPNATVGASVETYLALGAKETAAPFTPPAAAAVAAHTPPPAPAAPAPAAEAPRRRGRPRKDAGGTTPATPAPAAAADEAPTLYVNAIPVGEAVEDATVRLAGLIHETRETLKVPDLALVEYGKGFAALRVALKSYFASNPDLPSLVICGRSEGTDAFVAAATEAGFRIVRGVV